MLDYYFMLPGGDLNNFCPVPIYLVYSRSRITNSNGGAICFFFLLFKYIYFYEF